VLRLPEPLGAEYRLATAREVTHCSFGAVKSPLNPSASSWEQRVGTLADERIFGPLRDLECACGKYQGTTRRGMICDRCGVKVTTREARSKRFGHIDLPVEVAHPLGDDADTVSVVPVLPAAFRESPAGRGLESVYERLVTATTVDTAEVGLRYLIEKLLPVALLAHEWNLGEATILTQALVLGFV
jgi:hypothetical protein